MNLQYGLLLKSQVGAAFVKGEMCLQKTFNSNIVALRLSYTSYKRLVKKFLFGTDSENNDVPMFGPSDITNHMAIAISVHIIAVIYRFF